MKLSRMGHPSILGELRAGTSNGKGFGVGMGFGREAGFYAALLTMKL
jgi:hypothetical protein